MYCRRLLLSSNMVQMIQFSITFLSLFMKLQGIFSHIYLYARCWIRSAFIRSVHLSSSIYDIFRFCTSNADGMTVVSKKYVCIRSHQPHSEIFDCFILYASMQQQLNDIFYVIFSMIVTYDRLLIMALRTVMLCNPKWSQVYCNFLNHSYLAIFPCGVKSCYIISG